MPDDLFDLALRALGRKERSRAELIAWLAARGGGEDEVEEVIARLEAAGAIDDAAFARRYAEDKRELAGWGGERIAAALAAREIERSDIEAGLGGGDEGAELERAVDLLARRGAGVGSEADRARALGYLARRGYASETVHEAVRVHERRSRDAA